MKRCRYTAGVILAVLLSAGCGSRDIENDSVLSTQESEHVPVEETPAASRRWA